MNTLRNASWIAVGLVAGITIAAAQEPAPAQSADEVLGPVNAQRPLDDTPPPAAPSADASAPASPAPATPATAVPPAVPAAQAEPSAVPVDSYGHTRVGVSINALILTGFGVSIGMPLFDQFNLRATGNAFSISRDFNEDNNNGSSNTYHGKVKLQTYGLLFDWHPFHGAFRVTAGGLKNGNKVTLDGTNNGGTVDIGDCKYSSNPADPLRVHGDTNFRGFAPYAGLGWGGNMNADRGFYGTFDLGVMFSGSANIKLNAKGSAASASGGAGCGAVVDASSDPNVQAELAKDQNKLNDSANKVKVWPVIGFGLGWRF